MIGYYVHHQGSGHLHRAQTVAAALDVPVTGLSSLPAPTGWSGDWVALDRDDEDLAPRDATARGRLHWAPLSDPGLRTRAATLSSWIGRERPDLLVADVSVEVALLARLHGVPVVSVVLPGDRGDVSHGLGYGVSDALVAVWPAEAAGMVRGLAPADRARLQVVGGLSRFDVRDPAPRRPGPPRVAVLSGAGGGFRSDDPWQGPRAQTPDWEWTTLGGSYGTWHAAPYDAICDADVVVTHAGQNAVAEVAAARRPAVVVPAARPHDEQHSTAQALLRGSWPVRVEPSLPRNGWAARLAEVARLDGQGWSAWVDGRAASRFAEVLRSVCATTAGRGRPR